MAEEKTFSPEEIEARLEELRARKCQCDEPVLEYMFQSALVPPDGNGMAAVRDAAAAGACASLWFPGDLVRVGFWRILLASTCARCGRVELWRCDALDVAALCRWETTNADPHVVAVYGADTIAAVAEAAGRSTQIGFGAARLLDIIGSGGNNA